MVMFVGSMGGFIEGKESELGVRRGASSGEVSVSTTELPLLTIHNRIIHNGVLNRKRIRLAFVALSNDGGKSGTIKFKTNATLTGASFSDIDASDSVVRTDTTATAIAAATGIEQFDVALPKSGQIIVDLHDLKIELEPGDFLTISGLGSGTSAAFTVSANWVEI
jgi:hypothetical protein